MEENGRLSIINRGSLPVRTIFESIIDETGDEEGGRGTPNGQRDYSYCVKNPGEIVRSTGTVRHGSDTVQYLN